MIRLLRMFAGLVLLLTAAQAWAQTEELRMYGYAYDLKTGKYLYTEVHHHRIVDGRWMYGTIDYYAADGSNLAHKDLDFKDDEFVPVYRTEQFKLGEIEGISSDGPVIEMYKRDGADAPTKTEKVTRDGLMTADSGFHPFVRAHFADLMAGKTVDFRMIAAGRMDVYKFRIHRIDDTQFEGRKAVRFIVEPDSMLRFLIDPLKLTYDPATRNILEYDGVSNIHDPANGNEWVVRLDYYSSKPADAPATLPPLPPPWPATK